MAAGATISALYGSNMPRRFPVLTLFLLSFLAGCSGDKDESSGGGWWGASDGPCYPSICMVCGWYGEGSAECTEEQDWEASEEDCSDRVEQIVTIVDQDVSEDCEGATADNPSPDGGGSGCDEDGGQVYSNNCAGCHGSDGSALTPDLTSEISLLSNSELADVIQNGTGAMPAPNLDACEEDAVFLYLRDTFGEYGGS